jgi:hypothetical protein
MNVITRPTAAALSLLFSIFLTATIAAQQKRQTPAKTQPKAAVAPSPAPTFDTLVPADSYTIYGEVRGVGQLIRSSAMNDLLEPILKLAGPPKEFRTIVKWLNAHADQVMTSRLLVATWPRSNELPNAIVAIEFASPEEAAKFAKPLNEVLPTILPPAPESSPDQTAKPASPENPKPAAAPEKPSYYLQQSGSLILLTPKPLALKQLKPAGSRPLAEDQNFRAARNRFNSEPVFVFIDFKAIEREEEERRKQYQVEGEAARVKIANAAEAEPKKSEAPEEPPELTDEEKAAAVAAAGHGPTLQAAPSPETAKETPTPDPVSSALSTLASSFFSGPSDWPDGIGLALSFENDSFDLRALLVNPPGEKSDAIPFISMLIPGPAIVPESPNIFPADTELFATMSLDLPQIYATMTKPRSKAEIITTRGPLRSVSEVEFESPFAAIEKQLKIKIKDDLLPLLGSEIALRLPIKDFGLFGVPKPPASKTDDKDTSANQQPPATAAPVVAISLKDRDAMRALMPKLIESLGFKGASSFAQTERREDTEIVSYVNLFAYAFVGNFLVVSPDAATVRHVVDSYLKHETLASESQFKGYTRWQPRALQGQLYISPALMESYKSLAEQPSILLNDQTRAFLAPLTAMAQPITYTLSNEGFGPLHEVHLPKNLVLMAVVGISGEANPPPKLQNERMAIGLMYMIAQTEEQYKADKGAGSYGTLEQLIAAELVSKEMIESSGYRFELTVSGDKFEVSAVPLEYGKSGSLSLFMDNTRVLRGGDRNGASATSSDPPIN